MTTVDRLQQWARAGVITEAQRETLSALIRKERFSVFFELNALLYIGVLSLAAGLGWSFQTYFKSLGDAFILLTLSALLAGSLYYCFSRGLAYSNEELESPNFVFDYVLYLSCLILSLELGYVEFRFDIRRDSTQVSKEVAQGSNAGSHPRNFVSSPSREDKDSCRKSLMKSSGSSRP